MANNVVFDEEKCSSCNTCAIVCSLHWHNKINPKFATIKVKRVARGKGDFNAVDFCDECGECADVCPIGCIKPNSEGVLIINRDDCIGCGACADACPKGLIIGIDGCYGKCDGCGKCREYCYTGALHTSKQQEMKP